MSKLKLFPLLLWLCLGSSIMAQGFCALTARLQGEDNGLIEGVRYQLLNPSGDITKAGVSEGALIRICDFGLGVHRLVVDPEGCFPMTVSGLSVDLAHP